MNYARTFTLQLVFAGSGALAHSIPPACVRMLASCGGNLSVAAINHSFSLCVRILNCIPCLDVCACLSEQHMCNIAQLSHQKSKASKSHTYREPHPPVAEWCSFCKITFIPLIRPCHQCRRCGCLCCADCSQSRRILKKIDPKEPQRVCNSCKDEIDQDVVVCSTTNKTIHDQAVTLFCRACRVPVCDLCINVASSSGGHQGHDTQDLTTAAKTAQDNLPTVKSDIQLLLQQVDRFVLVCFLESV